MTKKIEFWIKNITEKGKITIINLYSIYIQTGTFNITN